MQFIYKEKKMKSLVIAGLLATTFLSTAYAKNIGETTALIPEAGLSTGPIADGESGNINFPFGDFKAIATVGEVDAKTGEVLTGYPDGQAAYLIDNDTIRVIYQSESYATMGRAPNPETFPWKMANGVSFTGSHIHYIDYDRKSFAEFMNNKKSAEGMVKGSGKIFNKVYNIFGNEVTKNGVWGNQTLPNGQKIDFMDKYKLSEADFFFQSFCGAWYEPANKYGKGIGFADDVWLTAEEWEIGRMFTADKKQRVAESSKTVGLASVVVDLKNQTAYTVPALGQTGYEKLMPINSGHKDYVVIVASGYNQGVSPVPLKVYVGMKDRLADGSKIDYATANERDSFLARNGLLYGKLYGMAVENTTASTLVEKVDPGAKMMEEYLKNPKSPDQFAARWYPTSYQWGGWDKTVAVKDTEMYLWKKESEQPKGYTFFNGDKKAEHPAGDPSGLPRYAQNMTKSGALVGVDFGEFDFGNLLNLGNDLPEYLTSNVIKMVPAVDGALTLELGGQGKVKGGDASIHMEKNKAQMIAPDGLYWAKTTDGDYLIVDEDSGNDFGERKYVLTIDKDMQVESGHLLAISGGKHSSRYAQGVSALGGAFTKPGGNEFSGSWPVTALIAKKADGSFYTVEELQGTARQEIRGSKSLSEQTYIGVVQARPESSGDVEAKGGDAGGQIFQFNIKLK